MIMARKKKSHWHPQYWLGLTFLYCLRPIALLPYSMQMRLGRWIGKQLAKKSGKMQRVAQINIARCFPHLDPQQQKNLYHRNFESLGMAFMEMILAVWGSPKKLLPLLRSLQGLDAVQKTLHNKQGVILLFPHLMPMYLVGHLLLLTSQLPFALMYHSPRNPALKKFMNMHLQKHCARVFTRRQFRDMIHYLQAGQLVWYAPDLDMGKRQSIFAPFFGVEAATLVTPARLAKLTKAKIFPIGFYRREDGKGYNISIEPALDNFPSGDETHDIQRINQTMQAIVQAHPEQYLWQYPRFQTRPDGEAGFY
jgi:Kdo2-lipid IVA lauroyltransferase/acyltransferase